MGRILLCPNCNFWLLDSINGRICENCGQYLEQTLMDKNNCPHKTCASPKSFLNRGGCIAGVVNREQIEHIGISQDDITGKIRLVLPLGVMGLKRKLKFIWDVIRKDNMHFVKIYEAPDAIRYFVEPVYYLVTKYDKNLLDRL